MHRSYLIAAGLLFALGGAAQAKGPGAVGGSNSPPPGFSSPDEHKGFDTTGSTPEPKGWDQGQQGKGDTWKQDSGGTTQSLPPGISGTK